MLLKGHLNLAFECLTMLGFTKLHRVHGDENNIEVQILLNTLESSSIQPTRKLKNIITEAYGQKP